MGIGSESPCYPDPGAIRLVSKTERYSWRGSKRWRETTAGYPAVSRCVPLSLIAPHPEGSSRDIVAVDGPEGR